MIKLCKFFLITILLPALLYQYAFDTVFAAPANPFPMEALQSDGTKIMVTGYGDEFFNWSEDSEDNVIAYDVGSGNWCYAYISDNRVLPGSQPVGGNSRAIIPKITRAELAPLIENAGRLDSVTLNTYAYNLYTTLAEAETVTPATGQQILLVLIEFNDVKLAEDISYWREKYFSGVSGAKSVADYYKEVSGGLEIFKPADTPQLTDRTGTVSHTDKDTTNGSAVITHENIEYALTVDDSASGAVKVALNMPHPVLTWSSTATSGTPSSYQRTRIALEMALKAIDDGFDFNRDDLHIAAVIAGFEGSAGSGKGEGQTWAHYWDFNYNLQLDGKEIRKYVVHGEKHNADNTVGIGVICHELGHALGLPDLYDTSGVSSGLGPYSLMANGGWGQIQTDKIGGETPIHLDAWSKMKLGYVTPITVNSDEYREIDVNSINLSDTGAYNVLKLTDTGVSQSQYFLVENRQLTGYDEGLFRYGIRPSNNNHGGILVYHVDEDVTDTSTPKRLTNKNKLHKGVDLEEADNNPNLDNKNLTLSATNHFFAADIYSKFNISTTPNTNFHTTGHTSTSTGDCHPQTVVTGIRLKINSIRGEVMEVSAGIKPAAATKAISITFSEPVSGLSADDITITGASKGKLTKDEDDPYVWIIEIKDIEVGHGEYVKIKIENFGEFKVVTEETDVLVYKAGQ